MTSGMIWEPFLERLSSLVDRASTVFRPCVDRAPTVCQAFVCILPFFFVNLNFQKNILKRVTLLISFFDSMNNSRNPEITFEQSENVKINTFF